MKPALFLFAALALLTIACKHGNDKQPDAGDVKGELYTCPEIGWSIHIPTGWNIISRDQLQAADDKGKSAIEKEAGQSIDIKGLKHLISFQKDKFDFLGSTYEPFQGDSTAYDSANHALDGLLYSTYINQGITADTSSGTVTVGGLHFYAFYVTINGPNGGVLLRQVLYSRLINGYDFGVNINYTNDTAKKVMMDAFMNSKFDKK